MKQKTYLFHTILVLIIIGIVLVIGYLGIQNNEGKLDENGLDDVNPESVIMSGCDVQNRVYFPVPEMGVEFFVSKGFVDQLLYKFSNNSLIWSTKELEKIDTCKLTYDSSSDGRYGPLGSMSVSGNNSYEFQVLNFGPHDPCDDSQIQNINDFFIALYGSGNSCVPFIRKIVQ